MTRAIARQPRPKRRRIRASRVTPPISHDRRQAQRDEQHLWKLSLLRAFVRAHGIGTLTCKTVVKPGVRIGVWLSHCRRAYHDDRLSAWLAEGLERIPGWSWDPRADVHRRRLALLTRYLTTPIANRSRGDRLVSAVELAKLARWIGYRRRRVRGGFRDSWLRLDERGAGASR
jgi:hypothetical protein